MLFWHFFRQLIFSRRAGSLIRRIAFLSIGGIGISVFAFLIVLFVMNGMNFSIKDRLLALEPHLVVLARQPDTDLARHQDVRRLQEMPGVHLAFFDSQDVIVRTLSGQFRGLVAKGIDEQGLTDFLQEARRLRAKQRGVEVEGEDLSRNDLPAEGEVVIGIDVARSLDLFEGDPVLVLAPESLLLPPGEAPRTERLRVKHIVSTNLNELDSRLFTYIRGKALRGLARSPARQSGLEIRIPNPDQAETWLAEWRPSPDLQVETWADRNSALFFALKMERLMIGIFLALAGLVAGASILTVMTLLLSHKKRDIALLRVMGLSRRRTISLFTGVGLTLASVAVLGGALLGTVVGLYLEANPLNVLPGEVYYDSEIPARFGFSLVLWTLLAAGILAFFGAWIPARGTSAIEPAHVLRKK